MSAPLLGASSVALPPPACAHLLCFCAQSCTIDARRSLKKHVIVLQTAPERLLLHAKLVLASINVVYVLHLECFQYWEC